MKNVLITGSSGGIGLAIAKQLASEGSQITLVARNADKLSEMVSELDGTGHQYIQADLSLQDGVDKIVDHLSESSYDVLINNAGVGLYGHFEELALETQMSMLALNINALVALSYAFLKTAKSGNTLMNVGSVLGISSFAGAAAYAGTKGFVIKFSESLWYEFKDRNIHIIAFCPGVTATNFHQASGGSEDDYPKMMIQTSEQVAAEAIKALQKPNNPTVISGFINRMMVFSGRLMSNKQLVKIMGGFSPVKPN